MEVKFRVNHSVKVHRCGQCGRYYAMESMHGQCPCCAGVAVQKLNVTIQKLERTIGKLRCALQKAKSDDIYLKP